MDVAARMEVVATAGHVDHGKSALLKQLTGMEPDRWDEERRRGLTIDLGYVWTDLEATDGEAVTVAFVDVPGHDDYLTNMLSGVAAVDQVLFVVAADDGWSAQSEEHLEIVDLLGRRGVVGVVTKADLAGQRRTGEVVDDVVRRFVGTSLEGTPVLAVDALSGWGIDELRTTLADRLSSLAALRKRPDAKAGQRPNEGGEQGPTQDRSPRLWIDRSFTVTGAGTIVTGLLTAGRLTIGDEVIVAPHGRPARVRGLQCLGLNVASVHGISRVAVNLAGIDHEHLARGQVLVAAGTVSRSTGMGTTSLDAQLQALPHSLIGRKGAWHLHVGTATTTVEVHPLLGDIEPDSQGHARLTLTHPLAVQLGDRFVLREAGRRRIVGGGVVLDPAPGQRPRGAEQRLTHALVLDELAAAADLPATVTALVDARGGRRSRHELAGLLGGSSVLDELLTDSAVLTTIADQVVRRDQITPWADAILMVASLARPDHAVERAALVAAAVERGCPRELAPALIDRLVTEQQLAAYGGRLVHQRHEPTYRDAREGRRAALLDELQAAPLQPPDPADVAARVDIPSFEIQALIDEGVVVSCEALLFTRSAIEDAEVQLRDGPGRDGRSFTASEARETWGTTRRAAVPLLEHLRATGTTTFDGTRHRLNELRP